MRFLLIFLFFSCASAIKIDQIESVPIAVAGIDEHDEIVIKKVTSIIEPEEQKLINTVKEPVVALTVYSSLYHSLASLELIKKIEKENINISYISSQGFGAIVAALYAKKQSTSNVEWSLFKLIKILKNEKIYTPSWVEKVNEFIDEEFHEITFDKLKVRLIIPIKIGGNKIDLNESGYVAMALKNNIILAAQDNFFQKPELYHFKMERLGIDINFAVSFIPETPLFSNINGYNYGVITRFLGLIMNAGEDVTIIRSSQDIAMDQLVPMTDINEAYNENVEIFIKQITQIYKTWKEDSSSSFHFQ